MTEEKEFDIKNKLSIKKTVIYFVIGIFAIVAVFCFFDSLRYQSTDDAYVETTMVSVAPKVAGEIIEVHVTDNQRVKKGDIVAKIDPRDYEVRLQQAEAAYQRELLNQKNARATLIATDSELELAKTDVDRYTILYNAGAVSKQTLDNAKTKYDSLNARRIHADENILSGATNKKVADANLEVLKSNFQYCLL